MTHLSLVTATNAPETSTPTAGTPVIRDGLRGFVFEVSDASTDGANCYSITGSGMQKTLARYSFVWADGTTTPGIPDGIAAPWFADAIRAGADMAGYGVVSDMLEIASAKTARDTQARAESKAADDQARQEFRAAIAPRIPDLARAVIVAELVQDKSDSMSDYWGSSTSRRIILGFSTHARDLFPEMRKAALNHPETAFLADAPANAEHREKYSMGAGFYLKTSGRHADGWKISKQTFYKEGDARALEITPGEISIDPPRATPAPRDESGSVTTSAGVTIEQHRHTKKGFDMWIVCQADRTDRATYDAQLAAARAVGGWYSRAWGKTPGGFAFKAESDAVAFAGSLTGAASVQAPAPAPGATRPLAAAPIASPGQSDALAVKLDAMADKLQSEIDDKFRDRAANTPKQRKQAAGARQDGNDLTRAQTGLRALAAMHRAGTVPATLATVKSKKAALDLARERHDYSRGGYYDAGLPTGAQSVDSDAARAFWKLAGPKSADDVKRDAIAALEMTIKNLSIPGFFPTPAVIVARMIDRADLEPGQAILEPEAGTGAIVDGIKAAQPGADVTCLEINSRLVELLRLKGHAVTHGDFMEESGLPLFDRVLMNPPFEKGQDVEHVRRAFGCLKPGGVMVAIMSPSWQFNSARKFADFRAWLDGQTHDVEAIDAGAFKESGTGVSTVLVTIYKAGGAV